MSPVVGTLLNLTRTHGRLGHLRYLESVLFEHISQQSFLVLHDYDPKTESPNPDGHLVELPLHRGEVVKMYEAL